MLSHQLRQIDFLQKQGIQHHVAVVRPVTTKRSKSIKLAQTHAPLPPLVPPRFAESPIIKDRCSISSVSSLFGSEENSKLEFIFTNGVTSVFQLDLSIRDLYENMESITLFWQDKVNQTEQDLKEEIQRMILNHTQEIQDFDSNKNISQLESIPTMLQVLLSSDGTVKAKAVQMKEAPQKEISQRNIRTGDHRAMEEYLLQRKLIIERQKSEIVKFNSECKIMINDIINQYLVTIDPLKVKLNSLLNQYASVQGIPHPLKELIDDFKGINSSFREGPNTGSHRILKIR